MSYAKAMKHHRNIRKCKKQASMFFGFDTGSGQWPSVSSSPSGKHYMNIKFWFAGRHFDTDKQQTRDMIRDEIKAYRKILEQE